MKNVMETTSDAENRWREDAGAKIPYNRQQLQKQQKNHKRFTILLPAWLFPCSINCVQCFFYMLWDEIFIWIPTDQPTNRQRQRMAIIKLFYKYFSVDIVYWTLIWSVHPAPCSSVGGGWLNSQYMLCTLCGRACARVYFDFVAQAAMGFFACETRYHFYVVCVCVWVRRSLATTALRWLHF